MWVHGKDYFWKKFQHFSRLIKSWQSLSAEVVVMRQLNSASGCTRGVDSELNLVDSHMGVPL